MAIPFDNSYVTLPESFYTRLDPTPVDSPGPIWTNAALAEELGIDPDWFGHSVFSKTSEISKQVFPLTLDIDHPRWQPTRMPSHRKIDQRKVAQREAGERGVGGGPLDLRGRG